MVFMGLRMLQTDPEGHIPGRKESEAPLFTLLLMSGLGGQGSTGSGGAESGGAVMMTRDGPVEVSPGFVESVARKARKVVIRPEDVEHPPGTREPGSIDPPASPEMREKVLLRDGGVCQNPFCGRRLSLQAAHIHARSKGGPTVLGNLTTLCVWCHGLEDEGLVQIRGKPPELEFTTPGDRLDAGLEDELRAAARAPLLVVAARPGGASTEPEPGSERDLADGDIANLAGGLVRLGWRRAEAREALRRARERLVLAGAALSPENLLAAALRGSRGARPAAPG
jgi:hypothetical protein